MTDKPKVIPINYMCAVRGQLAPNAMCGWVIVGSKECGMPNNGSCKHQTPKGAP